jgi:hypothetical protein
LKFSGVEFNIRHDSDRGRSGNYNFLFDASAYGRAGIYGSYVMKNLGGIIVVIGVVLLLGNVSGKFKTFPFAGGITIAIGAAMMRAG